ncbi:MAG: sodium:panthothenate symporter [Lentisphaeria bacterium]|nr:sodium:panthothenate symporter [Lentisphaeria bacterium]
MSVIDWIIVCIPVFIVVFAAIKSQRYAKGVADFLTAGRVAGRYVVSVASGEAAMGLISVVAIMEVYYRCGFAINFWGNLKLPIALLMGLCGYCTYRFRETRCMTMGQFFEVRYCKSLRVLASMIQSISGIINYAIFPAVGARFLIYFLDLPIRVSIGDLQIPTMAVCMAFFLGLALIIALLGGQVTIMVTDCVQGLLSYPMLLLIVIYICFTFSWTDEMMPALLSRPPGESFVNPYDVENLRDFNIFFIISGILSLIVGRISWGGTQGYNGAARSPHEAKMGGLLGTWRGGFNIMIYILLAVVAITYINCPKYARESAKVRSALASKAIEDSLANQNKLSEKLKAEYKKVPVRTAFSSSYKDREAFNVEAGDPYIKVTEETLKEFPATRKQEQTFRTIYNQMIVPVVIKEILPVGLTGIFCALMIFLMVSTDTTYMHSWGSIIVQDFVVPLRKKSFTPEQQLLALRLAISGVGIFAFIFSLFFAQIDFIWMFFSITGAIWIGAGIVIVLGLYWSRGTSAGAFSALISGAVIATSAIIAQQIWATDIYPALERAGLLPIVGKILHVLSAPFNPYIVWELNPHKFPINSVEITFFTTLITIILYVAVSLATCKKPFNMDKMLHRGIYSVEETTYIPEKVTLKNFFFHKVLGFDNQYTTGDKVLAWSVFLYSFGYTFLLSVIAVIIWNWITPWPSHYWGYYFFINQLLVTGIIALISTFWFGICGTKDLFRLFRDLETKKTDSSDNGRVEHTEGENDV